METKKTPEMRKKLLELRRKGLSLSKCYQAAGISKRTVQTWREEDPTLNADLEREFALFVEETHDNIVEGIKADRPELALKLLERLAPDDYGNTERHEHTFVLEMPGLLDATSRAAQAWLTGATKEDWEALDKRAEQGKLLEGDYELLEEPDTGGPDDD